VRHDFATPRRDAPGSCKESFALEIGGRRECRVRAAPAVSCAKCTKENAHEHTGQRRHFGIPCAMALRLMPRSPRRRIRLVTVIGGLKVLSCPVGPAKTSADLTPATGARTTRFCRTQLPVFAKRLRRALAPFVRVLVIAHGKPALRFRFTPDAAASTASHPAFVTIAIRPSCRDRTGRAGSADLPDGLSEIFFQGGLDRANHVDSVR
jgi:hypothetical protein